MGANVVRQCIGALGLLWTTALPAQESDQRFTYSTDLLIRAERTELPVREFDRLRTRLRLGASFLATDALEFGVAARMALGSDDNADNRANLDNQRSNEAALDQFWMRWYVNPDWVLLLGKERMPLALSPMLWDEDLRPIGVSSDWRTEVGDFDSFGLIAGYFAADFIYEDEARLAALQAAYRFREGAPWGGSILLSYLHFSDLDELPAEGISRTNRVSSGRLLSDYRLLNLQLVGRGQLAEKPLELRVDLVRNLGADDADEGARASLVWGNRREAGNWELGLAAQRMQQDAVLAAASDDDWWFHSFSRGVMPWVGYGFSDVWNLRVAAFNERRDRTDDDVRRYLIDLRAHW
ncbi:MAG: putative porin [Xanthomonadales bacterium]|nr:putative porin [Xanthomonadales bacterium]